VRLANKIAYGDALRPDEARRDRSHEAQIVLVDMDKLGAFGAVRAGSGGGRWWPAGSLVSHALAEFHRDRGETVGILTPYRLQRNATRDYLEDQGSLGRRPVVEVGTTRSF
jgi:superfamily I DNA/RNA helicase